MTDFLMKNVSGAHIMGPAKHWPAAVHHQIPQFQFAFVREPVSWFKSWYSFIATHYLKPFGEYPKFEAGLWHPQRRFEKYNYKTFRDFIVSVYKDEPSYYTRMLEWYVGPENANVVNFVGKQETLRKDLITVLHLLGITHLDNIVRHKPTTNSSHSNEIKVDDDIKYLIHMNESSVYRRFNYSKK